MKNPRLNFVPIDHFGRVAARLLPIANNKTLHTDGVVGREALTPLGKVKLLHQSKVD
jgi:hypothetical protein